MDQTELTKRRYDRVAPMFDLMERLMGTGAMGQWRQLILESITGRDILEVGVGTGVNLPFYPAGLRITGIDISPQMLMRARRKAEQLPNYISLHLMDVQKMSFANNSFDTVVSTCVFCSVPDPVQGLKEIHRVLRPGGQLVMLEHVLSERPGLRQIMRILNPVVVRLVGANIARETARNLKAAGFAPEQELLWLDVIRLFRARAIKEG